MGGIHTPYAYRVFPYAYRTYELPVCIRELPYVYESRKHMGLHIYMVPHPGTKNLSQYAYYHI